MIHFSIYNVQLIGLLNCKLQVFLVINMIVVDVNREKKDKQWELFSETLFHLIQSL